MSAPDDPARRAGDASVVDASLVDALGAMAIEAGAVALAHRGRCSAASKGDGSPVTAADREAEDLILDRLGRVLPGVPIVSEEAASAGTPQPPGDVFLLVDALDGTREFIAGSAEFTVNIALVREGRPVAGVVHAPALGRLWLGGAIAETCDLPAGATIGGARNRRRIGVRPAPPAGVVAMTSLRHGTPQTEAFLASYTVMKRVSAGSSVKFCLIAEGAGDLYPRLSPTMAWDTAAGHAVLAAAGGVVVTGDGRPLAYRGDTADFRNPWFLAAGDPALIGAPPLF